MIVELHLLQNFAPANLNRDDTGAPKDCEFGGVRRARISSQCQKRAIRHAFAALELLPETARGERTLRLKEAVVDGLVGQGRDPETADGVARLAIEGLGLKFQSKRPDLTEYLVFIGRDEIANLVERCDANWDALASLVPGKKGAKAALPPDVQRGVGQVLNGRGAADVALFGRMLADVPSQNREAACQVAHALSTNRVSAEFDYYTAVDDLKGADEDAGAGMVGTIEYNSACFYRYANVDLRTLAANLADSDLVRGTLGAFLRAAVAAIPTGKQNSFAAHNPPSLVVAGVRPAGQWSFANAFVKPIAPGYDRAVGREVDLVEGSIRALDGFAGRLARMYGDDGIAFHACVDPAYGDALAYLAPPRHRVHERVPDLAAAVVDAAFAPAGATAAA